jgi:GGDEF domain-containing protein
MGQEADAGEQVFREAFVDSWETLWAESLRETLKHTAEAIAQVLGINPRRFGILPAVYFPRLRMGSVMFEDWGANHADTKLAMPWKPRYIPPPFTCFAPPIAEHEEGRVGLITRVASHIDRIFDPRASSRPSLTQTGFGMSVGSVTWIADEDPTGGMVDEDEAIAAGMVQISATYAVPRAIFQPASAPPLYVPMLYVQAADRYDKSVFERLIRTSCRSGGADPRTGPIYRGLEIVARAARLRAAQWLNPKTHLLNQAGFDGLKNDLQRRVAAGELFAEAFFDIDKFKEKNDRFGYVGADLLASELIDRVLLAVQRSVADEYRAFRGKRRAPYGKPNGFRALIAHVSGDEFKYFVRSNLTATREDQTETDRLRASALLVVEAAGAEPPAARTRHARTFPRYSPTALFLNRHVVGNVRATVSLGCAVAAADPSWPISLNDHKLRRYPVEEHLLQPARHALDALDGMAERALHGAKRVPDRVLLSTELVSHGGRMSFVSAREATLLLGSLDGVQAGDEFAVYGTAGRIGPARAIIRVKPLLAIHRRYCLVALRGGRPLKPRREDYYLRLHSRPSTRGRRFVAAVLTRRGQAGETSRPDLRRQ